MDANLLFNLKKFMDAEIYEYTVQRLSKFEKLCLEEIDQRAARDSQKTCCSSFVSLMD